MGTKYQPLADYLTSACEVGRTAVDLNFRQIAEMVDGLPPSAYRLRQWWANDSKVEARAWRSAGWHVESVSLEREHVRFELGKVGGARAARLSARREDRA